MLGTLVWDRTRMKVALFEQVDDAQSGHSQ